MKESGDIKIIGNPRLRGVRLKLFIIREFLGAKTLRVSVNGKNLEDMNKLRYICDIKE